MNTVYINIEMKHLRFKMERALGRPVSDKELENQFRLYLAYERNESALRGG